MDIDFNFKIFSFNWKISIRKNWMQFAIIVMVLILSTILAYWGSRNILILFLGLMVGFAGALILIKQPNLVIIFVIASGMFIPFSGPGGVNTVVLAVALLIGLWVLDMMVVKRKLQIITSRASLPVVMLLIISIIAFGMGQIPFFVFAKQAPLDAQVSGFLIYVLSLGCMLATAYIIKEIKWLEIIVWIFIGLAGAYVLGRSIKLPMEDVYVPQATGSMFWTWLIALSFGQVVFNSRLKKSVRVLLFIVVLATFYVALGQAYDWKSGWVPALVAAGVILGLRYKKLIVFATPFALMAVAYLAIKLIATDEYSWGTRVDAWLVVLHISQVSPIIGMGFANYYWYAQVFSIRGYQISFNSHSQFVDLVAQTGVLGLLCFIWISWEVGLLAWKLSARFKDDFVAGYAYGVLAGVIGSLMAAFLVDWVLPFVYNIGMPGFRASILPWIFFGGLLSIEQIYSEKPEPADSLTLRERRLG